MSDAIDLTWMSHETINLYSVQEFLERLMQAVVPDAEATFASYTEPRYRAALQLGLAGTRAATGGVLTAWPGHPSGVESAHVRLLLEPWAAVHKGQLARFSPPPPA